MNRRLRAYFLARVPERPKGKCWTWSAAKTTAGYGHFYIGTKHHYAHRVAWEVRYGKIGNGLFVLHKCDNPSCVNHKHLFLGTVRDNSRDMIRKGRGWQPGLAGESHPMVKLSAMEVIEIRAQYVRGSKRPSPNSSWFLAKKYGLTRDYIPIVARGLTWKKFR